MLRRLIPLCLPVLLISARAPEDIERIKATLEADLKAALVPGAGIVLIHQGRTVAWGVGVADADARTSVDARTLMPIGSITKLVTALAVMVSLAPSDLDAGVARVWPGLPAPVGSLTFHQLLSHSSGLRDQPGDDGSRDESALRLGASQLNADDVLLSPGRVFSYSNLGYALAGASLEQFAQRPFADVVRDTVLRPLGMNRSMFRSGDAAPASIAAGHRLSVERISRLEQLATDTRLWPAGYLLSNAEELARLTSALMSEGRIDARQALPASAFARATTPHVPLPNVFPGGHYGYGLMIYRRGGELMYEHGGTTSGFSSLLQVAPRRRTAVVVLTNLEAAPVRRIVDKAMADLLRLSPQSPGPRTEAPVTPEELRSFLGLYRNRGTAELSEQDGRVMLRLDDGPPAPVGRVAGQRFAARANSDAPGVEFVLAPASGANGAYLHFALWAYTREAPAAKPRDQHSSDCEFRTQNHGTRNHCSRLSLPCFSVSGWARSVARQSILRCANRASTKARAKNSSAPAM